FAGGTTYETVRLVLDTEPRQPRLLNPKVDRDLNTICLKCLDKDPQRRYPSALALAEDIERWLKHEPIRARRTGLVTRGSKRVRVNAQLIDARTDRHLWGQTYERDLADVFTIQSEIAKTIADQLQAKLSPREENAIQRSSTSDISAFDLYARAKNILLTEGLI